MKKDAVSRSGDYNTRHEMESESLHRLIQADARNLSFFPDGSVHLAVTSPPYWTLKRYNEGANQLGHVTDYEEFLNDLCKVWKEIYRLLVPGGRLVCVVGDVCLSRRNNEGRHTVVPLHADICVMCRKIGFDNLNPIIWHKIANASYEVSNGSKFLGKPYEPNAIIKNDIEFILMQRKPGGYRKPTEEQRRLSMIAKEDFSQWFQQFWNITGASTKEHPAPFPLELALRLVRMFSFHGDTVIDPFCGTGTTMLAALRTGRNSIGVDIDAQYCRMAALRLKAETQSLFSRASLRFEVQRTTKDGSVIAEDPGTYSAVKGKKTRDLQRAPSPLSRRTRHRSCGSS
jgi:modification methylase